MRRIGLVAPALVLLGRLVQGLSAGVELGGVSVYLAEIATPGHKGFYVSWQSASQQVAVMFAALSGVLLTVLVCRRRPWGLGLAPPAPGRLPRSSLSCSGSAARCRRPRASSPAATVPRAGGAGLARGQLGRGPRGHGPGDDDHRVLLLHHRLHADVRAQGAAPRRRGRASGSPSRWAPAISCGCPSPAPSPIASAAAPSSSSAPR